MHNELNSIFENISDWLKFSEAKNAALLAFDGAVITVLFSILKDLTSGMEIIKIAISISIGILLASLFITLLSFYPQTRQNKALKEKAIDENDNLYFWEDIKKYEVEEYLKKVQKNLCITGSKSAGAGEKTTYDRLEKDLASQIIINSRITSRKYKYFEFALILAIGGIFTPIIAFIVYMWCNPNK